MAKVFALLRAAAFMLLVLGAPACFPVASAGASEDLMVTENPPGRAGGRIVVGLRSEPKTLNPILAADDTSRDVIRCMTSDLIHISRENLKTEPALAKSWAVSRDGKQYTLHLRQGLRFSDGQPLNADDVLFSFHLYLDEKVHSPQRDLLVIGGKPVERLILPVAMLNNTQKRA